MADGRKIILYFNVDTGKLVTDANAELTEDNYPFIYLREKPVLQLQLVNEDGTDYTSLESDSEYRAVIDNNFDRSDNVMVRSVDSNFNIDGDWVGGGNADTSQGELSCQLNADDDNFKVKLGSNAELTITRLEILEIDPDDNSLRSVFRMPFVTRNIMDDPKESGAAAGELVTGVIDLSSGVSEYTITGLALGVTPTRVIATIMKGTSSDYNMWATPVNDTLSTDGVKFEFNGTTDNANYKLVYWLF